MRVRVTCTAAQALRFGAGPKTARSFPRWSARSRSMCSALTPYFRRSHIAGINCPHCSDTKTVICPPKSAGWRRVCLAPFVYCPLDNVSFWAEAGVNPQNCTSSGARAAGAATISLSARQTSEPPPGDNRQFSPVSKRNAQIRFTISHDRVRKVTTSTGVDSSFYRRTSSRYRRSCRTRRGYWML